MGYIAKNKKPLSFTLFLAAVLTVFVGIPVLWGGVGASFYSIDPDVMYVSNAISYIKSKQIHYFDHPGVFTILILSLSYAPLRLYTELVAQLPFVEWVFNNYDFVFFYSRIFELLVLFLGLSILLFSLYKLTKNYFVIILSSLLLLLFEPFYDRSLVVSADTLGFLLTSIALLFLTFYIKSKNLLYFYALSFVAGLAFGNRVTSVALLFIAGLVSILFVGKGFLDKAKQAVVGGLAGLTGIYVSLWPLRDRISVIAGHIFKLTSGTEVHGGGEKAIFKWQPFLDSLSQVLRTNWQVLAIPLLAVFITSYLLCANKNRKSLFYFLASVSVFLVTVGFAKFPLLHYQFVNYVVAVFLVGMGMFQLKTRWATVFLVFVALLMIFPIARSRMFFQGELVTRASNLDKYASVGESKGGVVFGWSKTEEFALIWSSEWAGGIFTEMLQENKIYAHSPPDFIKTSNSERDKLLNVCWNKLYIRESEFEKYGFDKYDFEHELIPETDVYKVKSAHCRI